MNSIMHLDRSKYSLPESGFDSTFAGGASDPVSNVAAAIARSSREETDPSEKLALAHQLYHALSIQGIGAEISKRRWTEMIQNDQGRFGALAMPEPVTIRMWKAVFPARIGQHPDVQDTISLIMLKDRISVNGWLSPKRQRAEVVEINVDVINKIKNFIAKHKFEKLSAVELSKLIKLIDTLLVRKDYRAINHFLSNLNPNDLSALLTVTLLRSTFMYKDRLGAWELLLKRSRQTFEERGENSDRLLSGLL